MPLSVGQDGLLRSVMDASTDCIQIVQSDGQLLYMNPLGLEALEIADPWAVYGRDWAELWPAESTATVRQSVTAAGQGRATRFQAFCPTATGAPRWWDVSVAPILAEDGAISRLVAISRDVTDAKRAEEVLTANERQLRDTQARYEAIVNSIDQMIWSTLPDGFHDFYNRRWYEFTGVPQGSTDGEGWNGLFHPDDQPRAWSVWRDSLETGAPYHIEYRLRHRSGQYRWVIGRAQCVRDEEGRITRWYGTCTDIHDLKEAEAARDLIAQELSHRIKNIFAVVSSLVMLPALHQPEIRPYADSVQERIAALGMAHEYVRPHSPESAPPEGPQTFHGLLQLLAAPYGSRGDGSRGGSVIAIGGADTAIGVSTATSVALIFHELATNAVKYGALSVAGGSVRIESAVQEGDYAVRWVEQGGPALAGAPSRNGFGTLLSERVLAAQLDAVFERHWHPSGLEIVMRMPQAGLAR